MFDHIENRALKRRVKHHVIGKRQRFFAIVTPGFEHTLVKEVENFSKLFHSLGVGEKSSSEISFEVNGEKEIRGGVEFSAPLFHGLLYCLFSRSASSIVMRLGTFKSFDWFVLEREISKFPWELYLNPHISLKFRSTTRSSMIYHRGKLEEIFARGISRRLGEKSALPVTETVETPFDQELILRNENNRVEVSIDLTGAEFYKHGDLIERGKAPLRETLAALILSEAEFEKYDCIIDPMCGSGTFSIEAARILHRAIHGNRVFPFKSLPFFVHKRFEFLASRLGETMEERHSPLPKIFTSDIDRDAVAMAQNNCGEKFHGILHPEVRDFFDYGAGDIYGKTLIVLNPPYGKRIVGVAPLDFYRRLGQKLNGELARASVAIITPGLEFQKVLGLHFNKKITFNNGGIPSALLIRCQA